MLWSTFHHRPMGRLRRLEIFDAGRQPRAQLVNQLGCDQDVHMPPPPVTVWPATAQEWPVVERLAQLERHTFLNSAIRSPAPTAPMPLTLWTCSEPNPAGRRG